MMMLHRNLLIAVSYPIDGLTDRGVVRMDQSVSKGGAVVVVVGTSSSDIASQQTRSVIWIDAPSPHMPRQAL